MNRYIPNTPQQQDAMLDTIGLSGQEALFASIPGALRFKGEFDAPPPLSELEVTRRFQQLAGSNVNTGSTPCFLGAGAYDHYIPAAIDALLQRQEFYTAYTPYQPEISQGTLQAIFEFQSMICLLTGMDVANASMYDGASALAEAARVACGIKSRQEVFIARAVHPHSRQTLATYARFGGFRAVEYAYQQGVTDLSDLESKLSADTAAVIVQTPNFFGCIEDLAAIASIAHQKGALLIASCDPTLLPLVKSPGDCGADLVVGEGQPLGIPLNFGGPYLGFFAVKDAWLRKMPGRIAGETVDRNGKRGFVLTIQAREQHIRRDKATSNICSNQALCALTATIYLSLMGRQGMRQVAEQCLQKAGYAYEQLTASGAFQPVFAAPFFKEFVVRYRGSVPELNKRLLAHGILGGLDLQSFYPELANTWLVAVTEKRTKAEIDGLVREAAAR